MERSDSDRTHRNKEGAAPEMALSDQKEQPHPESCLFYV